MGFTDAKLISLGEAKYIGFENFINIFKDRSLNKVLFASSIYVFGGVLGTYIIGFIWALLLNEKFKFRPIARGLLILPWVVPQVVLALSWRWMFNPKYGVINYLLSLTGIPTEDLSWFTSRNLALIVILIVTLWKQYPLALLILLAGIQSIPNDLYEASSIDGANYIQRLFYITIPGLRYVSSVLILLLTIWHFQAFVVIWLLTKGGPTGSTSTLAIWTYLNAFQFNKLGYGAAIGIIVFLISLIFTIIYFFIFVRRLEND